MKRQSKTPGQLILFPQSTEANFVTPEDVGLDEGAQDKAPILPGLEIVVSGSFRKDLVGLRHAFEELRDQGFKILSPNNVTVVSEEEGFVFMQGEETLTPEAVELAHLNAIKRAAFVWLHAPEGYLGTSAALEVGFARASGIPVYSRQHLTERSLRPFVTVVDSPSEARISFEQHVAPPAPAVEAFQAYYARAAVQRGYTKESARDTLMLMLEEFGELAKAVRKRHHLRRDGSPIRSNEEQELADVFIYVVHMANVLGVDLASAVQDKEKANIERFLARAR